MANKIIALTEFIPGLIISNSFNQSYDNLMLDTAKINDDIDFGIIVNDINLTNRINRFVIEGSNESGKRAVLEEYNKWKENLENKCLNNLSCGLDHIQNINAYDINSNFYNFAYNFFKLGSNENHNFKNLEQLKNSEIKIQFLFNYFKSDFRTYDLNYLDPIMARNPQIFFETELRNQVSRNVQRDRKNNWRTSGLIQEKEFGLELGIEKVRNENKNPTCQGILLTLYEKLANKGYEKIIQHFPKESEDAIFRATKNYQYLVNESNKENLDYIWKPIKFETKFYGGK